MPKSSSNSLASKHLGSRQRKGRRRRNRISRKPKLLPLTRMKMANLLKNSNPNMLILIMSSRRGWMHVEKSMA